MDFFHVANATHHPPHELAREIRSGSGVPVVTIEVDGGPSRGGLPFVNPRHVDAVVDLTYGVLIFVSIVLIVSVGTEIGLAFGFGVLVSYAVHVVWKMARFDPDWMTSTVEEVVEESVREQVGAVEEQIEAVEQRVDRRPRETDVEEMIEETVENDPGDRSDG